MWSSDRSLRAALVAALVLASSARAVAQETPRAEGFAVERLYGSAPGGGWFVMDALDMRPGFGGAVSLTGGYARNPLRVGRANVVSDQAFATLGAAFSWDRLRVYLDVTKPMAVLGDSAVVDGVAFTAPNIDAGKTPDLFSDIRFGLDARVIGRPGGPFRAGVGCQLFVPSGDRHDYVTDGNYRAMARLLFAGDAGYLTWAAHLGAHVRDLDEPTAGSPRGGELLWGVAAGANIPATPRVAFVIGPEVFGASAFRSFFAANATALEGLLTARVEGTGDGWQLRAKLGGGAGLHPRFGAPEWRFVFGVEGFFREPRGRESARGATR